MKRWLKLDITWSHSEWLSVLSAESRLTWIELLCYVKGYGTAGKARAITPERFARMVYLGEESVRQLLKAAEIHGALEIQGHDWVITKWEEYQGDTGAERKKAWRDKKREAIESVSHYVPRDVTVSQRENENEREKENEKLPISPQLTTSGRERGVGERDLKGSEPTSERLSGGDAIASSSGVLPSEFDGMFKISVLADEAGEPDGPEERARALMVRSRIERNDQNHALGEPPPNESQADRIRRQAQEMRAARGA